MSLNFRTARVPFGYLFYCFIWIIWGSCADPAYAVSPRVSAQNALAGKTVPVLHAFESNVPIFELTDRGLRETLDAGRVDIRSQFFEYLDLARNPGPEHRRQTAELLRLRYGQRKIDIIITLYKEALAFLLEEGRAFFPDAPVFALYLPLGHAQPETTRPIIRQFVTPGIKETLEIALKLIPETREIFVVSGANPMDRSLENLARKDSQAWEDGRKYPKSC